jgi:hypothetical protein
MGLELTSCPFAREKRKGGKIDGRSQLFSHSISITFSAILGGNVAIATNGRRQASNQPMLSPPIGNPRSSSSVVVPVGSQEFPNGLDWIDCRHERPLYSSTN